MFQSSSDATQRDADPQWDRLLADHHCILHSSIDPAHYRPTPSSSPPDRASGFKKEPDAEAVPRARAQVRHSRVTAVWDDEPVPAVSHAPDQAPRPAQQPPIQQVPPCDPLATPGITQRRAAILLCDCVNLNAPAQPARKPWQPPIEGSPNPRSTEEDLNFSFGPASVGPSLAKVPRTCSSLRIAASQQ